MPRLMEGSADTTECQVRLGNKQRIAGFNAGMVAVGFFEGREFTDLFGQARDVDVAERGAPVVLGGRAKVLALVG
jgi:hypothetical protein